MSITIAAVREKAAELKRSKPAPASGNVAPKRRGAHRRGGNVQVARVVKHPLSSKALHKHLLLAKDGLWACYVMGTQQWAFSSLPDRESFRNYVAQRGSDLVGHRIQIHGTSRPTPAASWAKELDEGTPRPAGRGEAESPLPDVEGAESWSDYLHEGQLHIRRTGSEDAVCYLRVRLTTHKVSHRNMRALLHAGMSLSSDLAKIREDLRSITESLARPGSEARPATPTEIAREYHGSVGMGVPVDEGALTAVPDDWNEGDFDSFVGPVATSAGPTSKTVHVKVRRRGHEYDRYIAVLSVGFMRGQPEGAIDKNPWIAHSRSMPFPVDWVATFDVEDRATMKRSAERSRRRAEEIYESYTKFGRRPPTAAAEAIEKAYQIENDVQGGSREVAYRLRGPIRAAVVSPSEETTLEYARKLTAEYADELNIELVYGYDQYPAWREFIPGEPVDAHGFRHQMDGAYWATAVPNVQVGYGSDSYGFPFAETIGIGRTFVPFDPHWGPKSNLSGLILVGGSPGCGKSHTVGRIVEYSARTGRQTVVTDAAGKLGALCKLPHLRPYSRIIDLNGAEGGTLNPSTLVPEPRRSDFPNEGEYNKAVRLAMMERKDLTVDTLIGLLPSQLVSSSDKGSGVYRAVSTAAAAVSWRYGANPWDVVRALENCSATDPNAALSGEIAELLRLAADHAGASLIFPDEKDRDTSGTSTSGKGKCPECQAEMALTKTGLLRPHGKAGKCSGSGQLPEAEVSAPATSLIDKDEKAVLTVVTMRGLQVPPPDAERDFWTVPQRMAAPVLHLIARYCLAAMYQYEGEKTIVVEEAGIVGAGQKAFRHFINHSSLNSRKEQAAVVVAFQNPVHFTDLGKQVTNLVETSIMGRFADANTARAALPLLGVPTDHGFEAALLGLETGQFVMRYRGLVNKIRVFGPDFRPFVFEALRTDPKRVVRRKAVPKPAAEVKSAAPRHPAAHREATKSEAVA